MKTNKGFTLIELIIVIVVLGILAVTAAPQFIDFSSDARTSSMKGLKGSLQGAAQTVYGRASIDGQLDPSVTAANSTSGVALVNGYPAASADGIVNAADLDSGDWTTDVGTSGESAGVDEPGEGVIAISLSDFDITGYDFSNPGSVAGTACVVTYADADDSNTPPVITVDLDDC
ncbi:MAG: type II secretion system protein [Pseudomonadota bacterium]